MTLSKIVTGKIKNFTLPTSGSMLFSFFDAVKDQNVLLLLISGIQNKPGQNFVESLRDNRKFFDSVNTQLIGVSLFTDIELKKYKNALNLNFILLSDPERTVFEQLGCVSGKKAMNAAFIINSEKEILFKEVTGAEAEFPDLNLIRKKLIQSVR